MNDSGDITHPAAYYSLRSIATAAQRAMEHDQIRAARVLLQLFGRQVTRFEIRGLINAEAAELLRDSAQCISNDLP